MKRIALILLIVFFFVDCKQKEKEMEQKNFVPETPQLKSDFSPLLREVFNSGK